MLHRSVTYEKAYISVDLIGTCSVILDPITMLFIQVYVYKMMEMF